MNVMLAHGITLRFLPSWRRFPLIMDWGCWFLISKTWTCQDGQTKDIKLLFGQGLRQASTIWARASEILYSPPFMHRGHIVTWLQFQAGSKNGRFIASVTSCHTWLGRSWTVQDCFRNEHLEKANNAQDATFPNTTPVTISLVQKSCVRCDKLHSSQNSRKIFSFKSVGNRAKQEKKMIVENNHFQVQLKSPIIIGDFLSDHFVCFSNPIQKANSR